MKKLLTICLVMATIFVVKAQAHISTGKYVCNLVPKSRGTEKYLCPACAKIDEQKRIAKIADDKKRSDAVATKSKATQLATDAAHKKEMAGKNKVTEVKVVMPKNNNDMKAVGNKKVVKEKEDLTIMKSARYSFVNEKEEILFENYDWDTTFDLQNLSITKNALKNFGIVNVRTGNKMSKIGQFRVDVVDSKGEYLFNDENIVLICHIADGWLLIGSWDKKDYYVYNLLTKKKLNFSSVSNSDFSQFVYGPALELFIPILSDKVELSNLQNHNYQIQGKVSESIILKKRLSQLFPTQLNEEFLSKQSFVFVHTNRYTKNLAVESDNAFNREFAETDSILLYCVSKGGKLEIIKLK